MTEGMGASREPEGKPGNHRGLSGDSKGQPGEHARECQGKHREKRLLAPLGVRLRDGGPMMKA